MAFTTSAAVAVLAGLVLASAPSKAASADYTLTMKPLHGISFDVGTKRAVSYFLSVAGQCRLVLTLADPPDREQSAGFTTTGLRPRCQPTRRSASPRPKTRCWNSRACLARRA